MEAIKKYFWITHLLAIAICAYFAAQTATTYLSMVLEEGAGISQGKRGPTAEAFQSPLRSETDYVVIADRNIFNSVDAPKDLPPPVEEAQREQLTGPAVKTSLNIKILGTLVVGEGKDRRSSATIAGGKKTKAAVYFVGGEETFQDGVTFVQAKKDRIEFINKNRLEYAMLEGITEEFTIFGEASGVHGTGKEGPLKSSPKKEEKAAIRSTEENRFVIDQSEIDEALNNIDKLYTEIRIVPNFQGGQPAGMKVLAVKPGSLFSRLGIKRGDILERINGLELDIKSGMQLFSQLKDQKNLRIDLIRRGQNKTLEYEIR